MVEGDGTRSFRLPLLFRPFPQLLDTLQSALEGKAHPQGSKIEPMSTTPIRLILASASPARRKLLEDSRIAFTVRVSSVDEDAERISAMSGNYGVLHTGHALVDLRGLEPGAELSATSELPTVSELRSATVHFDTLSPEEIEAYIATGEPLWVAGSFTLDGYGSAFIRGIEGEFHTVVGLSTHALRDMLRRREVAVTELWLAPQNED